jgi:type IV pilus assembly protein PilB
VSTAPRKRLGQILIDKHLLLPEQLDIALSRQKESGKRIGQVLVDMSYATAGDIIMAFSEQSGVPHVWLRRGLVDARVIDLIPPEMAGSHGIIPMFKVYSVLTLGMADSSDTETIDRIEKLTGLNVQPVQCRREDIETAIEDYYGKSEQELAIQEELTDTASTHGHREELRMLPEGTEGAHVINLVNRVLLDAVKEGASDIHMELDSLVSRVRYRIDGILQEVLTSNPSGHPAIVSRVKVMSRMDIAERRLPQDGRILIKVEGKEIDIRVSTLPTVLGEKVVMRLLDKSRMKLDINLIGLSESNLAIYKSLLHRPHGIVLVTGPTGSGKTTTLYCGLSYISTVERNIVTIEDPVEYQLPMINQVQINEKQGLTFAHTLRSVLRQDPDVVMVGEIRDRETAEVAIQTALTGHLVLSTLHTNDSAGTIARLVDMGIDPFLLTSSINGVIALRLVRTICTHCRTVYNPDPAFLKRIHWPTVDTIFYHGQGCRHCFNSGLRGRTGVFECLLMNGTVRQVVVQDASTHAIRRAAQEAGMRSMKDEAFDLVARGLTTLEEIMGVVFLDDEEPTPALAEAR